MRIRRLDITGFKSFMDRMVFTFDEGITAVVGPNGCGKSNVVDAIRWVMGEQSAKNLRGRGMEDVIFNGSESQPPRNMAEVSLTFRVEPHDQLAPQYAGFPEVTVTRRLFRSGDSEYLINKTACRLLDITELFLGTGVGTRAYSIIEQGRVGLIVSAKPEDRRSLIEEAAGVTKYKARRRAAERKMDYTQQNLLRVTDIVRELDKRLESLARQARKAERYKAVRAEAREIELHAASHRFLELCAEQKLLATRLENSTGEEREGLARLEALEEEISTRRAALEEEQRQLTALAEEVHRLESQLQLSDQNLAHWDRDAQDTRQRIEQGRAELEALRARGGQLRLELSRKEEELSGLSGAGRSDEEALVAAEEEVSRTGELEAQLEARLELERTALLEATSRVANHESRLLGLSRARADLATRAEKVRAEAEVLRAEEASLDVARTEVSGRVDETRRLAVELAERKGQEEELLAQTRQAFAESEIQVISAREELGDKRSRLASLEEIQRNYEGFDRGVRAVMLRAGTEPRQAGIFGLISDLVATSPQYEKAVEAALGERLQHVVVESSEKAFELLSMLKAAQDGRSTFLPARREPGEIGLAAPDLTRPGVLAAAWSEVQCEEALAPLIRELLAQVVIVTDLETARSYPGQGAGHTLVTLEGEVLRADGTVTGGVLEGPAVGALQKKREVAELGHEVRAAEERYNEILTRHYTLQKQIGHAEGVLKGLAKNQHAEELNLANQEKDLHRASADLARIRERLSVLDAEEAELASSLQGLEVEEEASRGEVAHGQTDREGREEKVRQLGLELEGLRRHAEQAASALTELRVKVAANGERGGALRKELEQLAASGRELEERTERLSGGAEADEARMAELSSRTEGERATREAGAGALLERRGKLEEGRSAHAGASEGIHAQEAELKELRARLDSLTQGLSQFSLRERELALELSHLLDQVRERHQAELEEQLHLFHMRPPLGREAEARLRELRAQLEKMGEINLTAIEEHQEVEARHAFLAGQRDDLEASLRQLQTAITRIDRTSRERFKETFEVVNEKFQQIFPRLFGGGRAGLVLTQEGPGGEPGVEIVAQPPGKKLQSVNLLSGGEKALTAVSLIFAIFLIKPTPFCLLDEVDAPLDEGNVGRYNEMVREMSTQSQFILITHNKRTMEIGDTLYGVTMEEPGISNLVSVRMSEASQAANDDHQAA